MPISRTDQVLWLAGFLGHLCLLGVLLIRQRSRRLPVFTGFIIVNLLRTIMLFGLSRYGGKEAYFLWYWALALVDLLMQCALAYEIAYRVFRPYGRWAPDVSRGWVRLLTGATIIATGLAVLAKGPFTFWEEALVVRGNLFATALMAQIFVGMVAISTMAGLPFETHASKIAKAFGVYAIFDLLLEAARTFNGAGYASAAHLLLFRFRGVLYIFCVAYWAITLWQNAPGPKTSDQQLDALLRDVGSLFSPTLPRNSD